MTTARTARARGGTTRDFTRVFSTLRLVLAESAKRLAVKTDSPVEYTLCTKSPSPFPQHKGHPMCFGSVRIGKTYVSFHLMPLYMNPSLLKTISPALKKRLHGKSCFNFASDLDPEAVVELQKLTAGAVRQWTSKNWL